MSADDHILLSRWVTRRDPEAFRALAQRHAQMIFATCRRILRNDHDAQDSTQDCFLALIRAGAKPGPYLGPWLHRVATNLALKKLRSDSRRGAREQAFQPQAPSGSDESWQEIFAHVDAAISELPDDQRNSLVAYFLEGVTHEQIAARSGITRQGAAYRIDRAVESIRGALAKKGITTTAVALTTLFASERAVAVPAELAANLGKLALHSPRAASPASGARSQFFSPKIIGSFAVGAMILVAATLYFLPQPNEASDSAQLPDAVADQPPLATSAPSSQANAPTTPSNNPDSDLPIIPAAAPEDTPSPAADTPQSSGVELTVFVIDDRGYPVSNASVALLERDEGENLYGLTGTASAQRTDQTGIARFDNLTREEAYVNASAPGFIATPQRVTLRVGSPEIETRIMLTPGVTLTGRVLLPNRTPVPNAVVQRLTFASARGHGSYSEDVYRIAITNSEGTFELGFECPGQAALKVANRAHGETVFPAVPVDGTPVELVLQQPASLSGVITYTDDRPAAGVQLRLEGRVLMKWTQPNGETIDIDEESDYLIAVTDDRGRYAFDRLAPDAYYLIRVKSAEGREISARVNLGTFASGEHKTWDHAIGAGIRVTGTVTGEQTGKPIRNVRVSALKDGEITEGAQPFGYGSYEVLLYDPGDYLIFPEYNSWDRELTIDQFGVEAALTAGEQRTIDFKLPDQFELSVRVIDASGEPIVGARCDLLRIGPQGPGLYGSGMTDDEGRYSNAFVPDLESWFYVSKSSYTGAHSPHITGEAGETYPEDTVVLYPTGGLEGVAIDPTGAPLANAELKLALRAPGLSVSHNPFYEIDFLQTTTDANGYFAIADGFPAVTANLHIDVHLENNDWYEAAVISSVNCTPSQVTHVGRISLAPPR